MITEIVLILVAGVLALLFALFKAAWVNRRDPGDQSMVDIGRAVREGAMAFLSREYRVLLIFVIAVAILLFFANQGRGTGLVAASFVVGAFCSGLAGFFGMRVATAANNLGGVLYRLGDLEGAREALERALAIDGQVYGPDHPAVAIRVNNLGRVLRDLGDLEGARRAYGRALAIWEATLLPGHQYLEIARENLEELG